MPDEPPLPRSGEILLVGRAASVQFTTPIMVRVIRVHDWQTYVGWIWLDVYEINSAGDAIDRRSIFVQVNGLRRIPPGVRRAQPEGAPDDAADHRRDG
ncbi:hypothetical protein [Actinoplanes sp. HUAS TT8]|uniref:hypothetical protein n=1 Tax=Actinoplanes sp. HUAS TT8 TaxID=3447453 RepID=UPI003F51C8E7